MLGNAEEWCLDLWHENYQDAPLNWNAWMESGEPNSHVKRGGGWYSSAMQCIVTRRERTFEKHQTRYEAGLRVVMVARAN
jgi:formylglycine-generating enzyme required for sulfatase activity